VDLPKAQPNYNERRNALPLGARVRKRFSAGAGPGLQSLGVVDWACFQQLRSPKLAGKPMFHPELAADENLNKNLKENLFREPPSPKAAKSHRRRR
jgi:hypothetical protein